MITTNLSIAIFIFIASRSWCLAVEPNKALPRELIGELEFIKEGSLPRESILKTAEKLLKIGESEKASTLYEENIRDSDPKEVKFNRITALLKSGKINEGLTHAKDFLSNEENDNAKNMLRKNILKALKAQESNKDKDNDNDKDKNKDKNKEEQNKENQEKNQNNKNSGNKKQGDQKKQEQRKENEGDRNSNDKNKSGKDEEQKNDSQSKAESNDKKKYDLNGNQKDNSGENEKEEMKKEGNSPRNFKEKEKQIAEKRKMIKTPAMIKQILNDDRELQKIMLDTSGDERGQLRPKRDW